MRREPDLPCCVRVSVISLGSSWHLWPCQSNPGHLRAPPGGLRERKARGRHGHLFPSSVCSLSPAVRADWLGSWTPHLAQVWDTRTVRNKCWLEKLRPGRGGDLKLLTLFCLQSPVSRRPQPQCLPTPASTEHSVCPAVTASADPLQTPPLQQPLLVSGTGAVTRGDLSPLKQDPG